VGDLSTTIIHKNTNYNWIKPDFTNWSCHKLLFRLQKSHLNPQTRKFVVWFVWKKWSCSWMLFAQL